MRYSTRKAKLIRPYICVGRHLGSLGTAQFLKGQKLNEVVCRQSLGIYVSRVLFCNVCAISRNPNKLNAS